MKKYAIIGSVMVLLSLGYLPAQDKLPLETGLMLRKRVEVAATPRQVFERFTTVKGIQAFFAPEGKVELAVNGAFEMYFMPDEKTGGRGSEDCKILSFIPGEMLSFCWNNPPQFSSIRKQFSWVVLLFTPLPDDHTQIDLIHLGFRAGPQWQEALKYFDGAWNLVLKRLAYSFSTGPIDWKKPYTPD